MNNFSEMVRSWAWMFDRPINECVIGGLQEFTTGLINLPMSAVSHLLIFFFARQGCAFSDVLFSPQFKADNDVYVILSILKLSFPGSPRRCWHRNRLTWMVFTSLSKQLLNPRLTLLGQHISFGERKCRGYTYKPLQTVDNSQVCE